MTEKQKGIGILRNMIQSAREQHRRRVELEANITALAILDIEAWGEVPNFSKSNHSVESWAFDKLLKVLEDCTTPSTLELIVKVVRIQLADKQRK